MAPNPIAIGWLSTRAPAVLLPPMMTADVPRQGPRIANGRPGVSDLRTMVLMQMIRIPATESTSLVAGRTSVRSAKMVNAPQPNS